MKKLLLSIAVLLCFVGFSFAASPVITSISPTSGIQAGGTTVVITGTTFSGADEVDFGGTQGTIIGTPGSTSITVTSPAGVGVVPVIVWNAGLNSNSKQYTYLASTATATKTPTNSPTNSPTNTPTISPTNSLTNTPTITRTATLSPTNTATRTPSNTPTSTPTNSPSNTPTATATGIAGPSTAQLQLAQLTPLWKIANVVGTYTFTPSPSFTPNLTNTITPTPTFTNTPSNTPVPASTAVNLGKVSLNPATSATPAIVATAIPSATPIFHKVVFTQANNPGTAGGGFGLWATTKIGGVDVIAPAGGLSTYTILYGPGLPLSISGPDCTLGSAAGATITGWLWDFQSLTPFTNLTP